MNDEWRWGMAGHLVRVAFWFAPNGPERTRMVRALKSETDAIFREAKGGLERSGLPVGKQWERYGQTRVSKIYAALNNLRRVIRSEGTPAIQDAWDRLEPWVVKFLEPENAGKDRP